MKGSRKRRLKRKSEPKEGTVAGMTKMSQEMKGRQDLMLLSRYLIRAWIQRQKQEVRDHHPSSPSPLLPSKYPSGSETNDRRVMKKATKIHRHKGYTHNTLSSSIITMSMRDQSKDYLTIPQSNQSSVAGVTKTSGSQKQVKSGPHALRVEMMRREMLRVRGLDRGSV